MNVELYHGRYLLLHSSSKCSSVLVFQANVPHWHLSRALLYGIIL